MEILLNDFECDLLTGVHIEMPIWGYGDKLHSFYHKILQFAQKYLILIFSSNLLNYIIKSVCFLFGVQAVLTGA
jgi:hypothetical protein